MTREPPWIEHDGSETCPTPAGHDVEVRWENGEVHRDQRPEKWIWGNVGPYTITHYRDCTAFEEQETMKTDDVPEDVADAISRIVPVTLYRTHCGCEPPGHEHNCRGGAETFIAHDFADADDARLVAGWLIAAHEPAPVDPLREIVGEIFDSEPQPRQINYRDWFTAELRSRGVTLTAMQPHEGEG